MTSYHRERLASTVHALRNSPGQFLTGMFSNDSNDDQEWSDRLEPLWEFEPYAE
jgi:hypothetical protein